MIGACNRSPCQIGTLGVALDWCLLVLPTTAPKDCCLQMVLPAANRFPVGVVAHRRVTGVNSSERYGFTMVKQTLFRVCAADVRANVAETRR